MNINISFTGMEPSDALRTYFEEKITKQEELLADIINMDVVFKESVHSKGIDKDFTLDINIVLPKATVHVDEQGSDMYAIIDKASDIVTRRLRRYYDRKGNWEGTTPWKVLEAQEALMDGVDEDDSTLESYADYVPKISLRKKLNDMTPMSEGEAIEKMELLGDRQILFKNSSTGKFSMIYADSRRGYVIVEPSEALDL
ncbi:MAG TPA: ribosome-associated translation inhibitor RaiA [Candidatus Dojkabacteria bacterium]|nr:ribosome-associated translation inhibitor RaiA [Candidatus Dojkabacteria bacterium]